MKRLILLRHAKAVAKDAAGDFDRALASRGRADMKPVAHYLAKDGRRPDLALVSPARRTRETWSLAGAGLDEAAVSHDERIYEAPAERLLDVIREADGVVVDGPLETLILVGHNPGISELAQALVGRGAQQARARLAQGLPTAGIAVIDFDVGAWRDVAAKAGELVEVVSPEALAQG